MTSPAEVNPPTSTVINNELRQALTRKSAVRPAEVAFSFLCKSAAWSSLGILCVLVGSVMWKSWGYLDWQFLTSFPSRKAQKAGIVGSLAGTSRARIAFLKPASSKAPCHCSTPFLT